MKKIIIPIFILVILVAIYFIFNPFRSKTSLANEYIDKMFNIKSNQASKVNFTGDGDSVYKSSELYKIMTKEAIDKDIKKGPYLEVVAFAEVFGANTKVIDKKIKEDGENVIAYVIVGDDIEKNKAEYKLKFGYTGKSIFNKISDIDIIERKGNYSRN